MVTGAAGGIGSAVTGLLTKAGAKVVAVDLPGKQVEEPIEMLAADVSTERGVSDLFTEFESRFDRLDSLVHCAGITRDTVVWKMDPRSWSEVLRVNLDSAFLLLHAAVPLMRKGSGGTIVLVSSINAERGKFGQSNYAASKAGLIGLGRSVAREAGRFGIRVNIVAPGWIDTEMTSSLPVEYRARAEEESPLGVVGSPADVAGTVLFLVTPMSSHVTGQVVRVDGGQLMG